MSATQRGPVTLAELSAGLIWPRIFRAFPLSAAPSRLAIGFLGGAGIAAVGSAFDSVRGRPLAVSAGETRGVFETLADGAVTGVTRGAWGVATLNAERVIDAMSYAVDRAGAAVSGAPLSCAALGALLLPIFVVCGLAICRSVACDAAWRLAIGPGAALRFGMQRARSGLGAMLIPGLALGAMALILLIAGWLMRWPGLNLAGGAIYGPLLLLGGAMVFVGVGVAFAQALLLPAIAADGADAIDAAQRAYAYVYGRPGRMLLYLLPMMAIGALALVALSAAVAGAINITADLTHAWSGGAPRLGGGVVASDFTRGPLGVEPQGSRAGAAWLVRFWEGLAALLLVGWVLSYHFTGGTLLYLLLRRVNDEQDVEDIWVGPQGASTLAPADARAPGA